MSTWHGLIAIGSNSMDPSNVVPSFYTLCVRGIQSTTPRSKSGVPFLVIRETDFPGVDQHLENATRHQWLGQLPQEIFEDGSQNIGVWHPWKREYVDCLYSKCAIVQKALLPSTERSAVIGFRSMWCRTSLFFSAAPQME